MSFSPDRVRVRGRSPAFNALAANFEKPDRNLSTPPPAARKLHQRSLSPDPSKIQPPPKSAAIAALSSSFEKPPAQNLIPRVVKVSPKSQQTSVDASNKPKMESNNNSNGKDSLAIMSKRLEALAIQEDVKEGEPEGEEGLTLYPYLRLITTSNDPAPDIDVTKRETYLSSAEFREKFGMTKEAFAKLPKWKQNRLKMALLLF